MKQIIAGKRYDTNTATYIGSYTRGDGFTHCRESLYQKRTGEFFLHGEGGAMTKYAVSSGDNEWGGGEKLIPLSRESARDWAEKNLDADIYEQLFEVIPDDDGGPEALHVQLTSSLMAQVRRKAQENGLTLRDIVAQALIEFISDDDA